jgi:hypothetical protein
LPGFAVGVAEAAGRFADALVQDGDLAPLARIRREEFRL